MYSKEWKREKKISWRRHMENECIGMKRKIKNGEERKPGQNERKNEESTTE